MDESCGYFDEESKEVERLAKEYRRLHLALGALHLGLKITEGPLSYDDGEWCEIELEKLYWHLDALGAAWRVSQIEVDNGAILAEDKKRPARKR